MRKSNTYVESDTTLEYATVEERELLELERVGKTKLASSEASLRTRMIHTSIDWYKRVLRNFLEHTYLRRISIFLPFILFILSIVFLAPRVGFELFPGDDNNLTTFAIE